MSKPKKAFFGLIISLVLGLVFVLPAHASSGFLSTIDNIFINGANWLSENLKNGVQTAVKYFNEEKPKPTIIVAIPVPVIANEAKQSYKSVGKITSVLPRNDGLIIKIAASSATKAGTPRNDGRGGLAMATDRIQKNLEHTVQANRQFGANLFDRVGSFLKSLFTSSEPTPKTNPVIVAKRIIPIVPTVASQSGGAKSGNTIIQQTYNYFTSPTSNTVQQATTPTSITQLLSDFEAYKKSQQKLIAEIMQVSNVGPRGNIQYTISNPTFTGTAQGLDDGDIPDDITVQNYLPLTGGSISGNLAVSGSTTIASVLNVSGNLNVGGIVFDQNGQISGVGSLSANIGISSSTPGAALAVKGAGIFDDFLNASFIRATSTTATSTFDGGVVLARSAGNVGVGTSTPGSSLLSVAGSTLIGGNLTVTGTVDLQGSCPACTQWTTTGNDIYYTTGNVGVGTNTPNLKLEVAGFGVVKGNFNIEATSTASSLIATSTLSVASSSPNGAQFAVVGKSIFGGDVTVTGTVDLQGTCKGCGSPGGSDGAVQFNSGGTTFVGNSGLVFSSNNLTLTGDLFVNGSDINLGNGITATSTLSGGYGKLGFGSTSPSGQVSIEADNNVVGSTTPIFVIGDQGTSAPLFIVSGTSNGSPFIGIGTSSPNNALEVAGFGVAKGNFNIEATSTASSLIATSTLSVGTSTPTTNNQLAVLGNAYITQGLGIGVATTSDGGLFVKGSADIYDGLIVRGGKVGIGTAAPTANLHIPGSSGAPNATPANSGVLKVGNDGASVSIQMGYVSGSRSWIQSYGSVPLQINELGNNVILNSGGGNVGIGATPSAKLHVQGPTGGESARFTDAVNSTVKIVHSAVGRTEFRDGSDSPLLVFGSPNVGIGTTTPGAKLAVEGFGVVKGNFNIEATSTASSFIATSTLSVGTSTPGTNTQLSVGGNAYISGGLGVGAATTSAGGLFVKGSADIYDGLIVRGGRVGVADTNNGIFSPAANTLGFMTNYTERARILSTGQIGIARTGPSTTLEVVGTTTTTGLDILGRQFYIGNGITATSSIFGQYGNLGFASTVPFGQVSIEADKTVVGTSTPIFVVGNQGSSTPFIYVSGNNGFVGFGTSSPSAALAVGSGAVGDAIFGNNVSIVGNLDIQGTCTGCGSGGWTSSGGTVTLTTATDNVGIGTSTPNLKLEVAGFGVVKGNWNVEATSTLSSVIATSTLEVRGASGFDLTVFDAQIGVSSSTPYGTLSVEQVADTSNFNEITPAFVVGDSGTATPSFIVMNSLQRVGVATNTPSANLSVAGNVLISGTTTVQEIKFMESDIASSTPGRNTLYANNIIKAWVNFDGIGNIYESFNISSITALATGDYQITFLQNFATGYWAAGGLCRITSGTSCITSIAAGNVTRTSNIRVTTFNDAGTAVNADTTTVLLTGIQ